MESEQENVVWRKQLGFVILMLASAFAQNSKPDFSGTWKYQEYEVDRIEHREPILKLSPVVRRADVIFTQVFRTDGEALRTNAGSTQVYRSAHWEANDLILETKQLNNGEQITEKITLSLSEDGTQMTKHIQRFGPDHKKLVDDWMFFSRIIR